LRHRIWRGRYDIPAISRTHIRNTEHMKEFHITVTDSSTRHERKMCSFLEAMLLASEEQ
jgi:hypothetical protein